MFSEDQKHWCSSDGKVNIHYLGTDLASLPGSLAFVFCRYIFLLFYVANLPLSPVLSKTQNRIYLHYTDTLSLEMFRI